jgi:hypothetical protein
VAWLPSEPPRWLTGEWLLLVLFVALGVVYVGVLPSFEGPDESEHARYVQAFAEGAVVHPVSPEAPLRWGFQVHHPPLYYWLAGTLARPAPLAFHESLVINRMQNPRVPFIRHDIPGQRFPFDTVGRSLRALRLLSLVFGIAAFLVLRWAFALLFPDEPASRCFLLAASFLAPNTLQIFSTVSNDGLGLLFSWCLLLLTIETVRHPGAGRFAFLLAGACAGLAVISKLTGLAAVALAGSVWAADAIWRGPPRRYAGGLLSFFAVFLLVAGPTFVMNVAWYGDPTRESLLRQLTPAYYLAEARPLLRVLGILATHLPEQLAADLAWQTVRLPTVSAWLFWPWLASVLLSGVLAWRTRDARGQRAAEWLMPVLALGWGLALLVVANRHWSNLQIRHVWALYPFTLIGLVRSLQLLPVRVRAWGRPALGLALAGLLLLNAGVLMRFQEFYRPGKGTLWDRDYYTFLYTHTRDPARAREYLRNGR